MKNINKQETGFRFGKHRLKVLQDFGIVGFGDNVYQLVLVETEAKELYYSLRLYHRLDNRRPKHFIKQILIDIPVLRSIGNMMIKSYPPAYGGWR